MKTNLLNRIILGVAALTVAAPVSLLAQKETLGVADIKLGPSLVESVQLSGKRLQMGRVVESLDGQLIDRLNATRKFTLVGRSDVKQVVKEQEFGNSGNVDPKTAAQQFKLAGAKYLLVTTIDDFQDNSRTAPLPGGAGIRHRRDIRLSAVGKIYDASNGKLLESANFQVTTNDVRDTAANIASEGTLTDELMVFLSRDMAEKLANRVADVIFPAKVLAKRDKQITVNRGEGSGVALDQVWNVFAVGEELIDPDTKESLGREEVLIGKAKVVSIQPKTTTAELVEDRGVAAGCVLRLPQSK